MGDGGSTKASPSRNRKSVTGSGKPARVACHRRSVSGGGSRVSVQLTRLAQEGSMPECAGMQGGCNGGRHAPLAKIVL